MKNNIHIMKNFGLVQFAAYSGQELPIYTTIDI